MDVSDYSESIKPKLKPVVDFDNIRFDTTSLSNLNRLSNIFVSPEAMRDIQNWRPMNAPGSLHSGMVRGTTS